MKFECYAERLLNPFRGITNTIRYQSAEAVTADGVRWDIYVSNEALQGNLPAPDDYSILAQRVPHFDELTVQGGATLDVAAYAKYPELSESEVKTLVVDDKWLAALETAIASDMDRVSQGLTRRVKELAERYETPLPAMSRRVVELEAKVNGHLEKMGFSL